MSVLPLTPDFWPAGWLIVVLGNRLKGWSIIFVCLSTLKIFWWYRMLGVVVTLSVARCTISGQQFAGFCVTDSKLPSRMCSRTIARECNSHLISIRLMHVHRCTPGRKMARFLPPLAMKTPWVNLCVKKKKNLPKHLTRNLKCSRVRKCKFYGRLTWK